jgi:hypothetical protein
MIESALRRALRPRSASHKAGGAKVVFEVFVERFAEMRSIGAVRSRRERDESTNLVCGEIDRYFRHILLHLTSMLPPTGIRVNPLGLPDLTLRDAASPVVVAIVIPPFSARSQFLVQRAKLVHTRGFGRSEQVADGM